MLTTATHTVEFEIAPTHLMVHMGVVEDMLPYVKQSSSQLLSGNNEHNRKFEKPVVARKTKLICEMIRLEVRFPLQDRYYDVLSHTGGRERLIVLDMTDINIGHTTETPHEFTFAEMHVFFGLLSSELSLSLRTQSTSEYLADASPQILSHWSCLLSSRSSILDLKRLTELIKVVA